MTTKDKYTFPKGPIGKDESAKLKNILDSMEKDPQAYDFLTPVNYVELGLDDYPKIIKNPMDVSTIKKNLKNNKYTNTSEVFSDIQLIWDNCRMYNMEGSEIYKMANHCEKLVRKLTEKYFKSAGVESSSAKAKKEKNSELKSEDLGLSENDENENADNLSLQEKVKLTDSIRKLSNKGLSALVRLIQKQRPQAIEDLDNEKLQIKIDQIDRKTLKQIEILIESSISNNDNLDENAQGKKNTA